MPHSTEINKLQEEFLLGTYLAKQVLVRGEGARVWDAEGREFLDFTSGISVCNLGHCPPAVTAAISEQAGKLVHVSNLFVNELQPKLAAVIAEKTFGGRTFFANSGAEANEGMIKFARKWGAANGGRHEIICMRHSFHGRTLATLAATDKAVYREGFGPDMPGFSFVPFNDLAALAAAISSQTAAVLLEPVQGEGGIIPAEPEYLRQVRQLCTERGVLLLFDEVQCGMGRCGEFFAHQIYNVEPDAMSMAKALGNGFPIGAFTVQRQWEGILTPGSHASTFGGTPLACAAGLAVFAAMAQPDFLPHCRKMAAILRDGLENLKKQHNCVEDVRGLGLMLGLVMKQKAAPAVTAAAEQGLLVLTAGEEQNVLRLLPPLIITETEINQAVSRLHTALGACDE